MTQSCNALSGSSLGRALTADAPIAQSSPTKKMMTRQSQNALAGQTNGSRSLLLDDLTANFAALVRGRMDVHVPLPGHQVRGLYVGQRG